MLSQAMADTYETHFCQMQQDIVHNLTEQLLDGRTGRLQKSGMTRLTYLGDIYSGRKREKTSNSPKNLDAKYKGSRN